MITITPEFQAAQESDSAAPSYLVNLVLPDLCASAFGSTVTSSGDDVSGNYPKEGAINSDHTELNIGAAASADNGVGKASWKSSIVPDGSGNVWYIVNFGSQKKFHRVKLYNLASDPLTSYLLQYWNGSTWVDFAGSPDKFTPPGTSGYGSGGYGGGPWGGTGTGWPGAGYTGGLDVYDFAAITSNQIKLIVYSTHSGGAAQLVELEAFRVVDITSRVTSLKGPDRKKDFKLSQPIAAQEIVVVDNSDQFFSPSYVPTAAQVAQDYVNSDLALLGINLEVSEGFYTINGKELIRTFTGSIDSITPTVASASCEIQARDFTKHLMDQQDSCKLKTSIDVGDCIKYVLNRNGVSNYEMAIATTSIIMPYFFYYESALHTIIQKLVQASGDAIFFFDEFGVATLNYFLVATPQNFTDTLYADFHAGTYKNNVTAYGYLIEDDIRAFFLTSIVGDTTWSIQTTPTLKQVTTGGSGAFLSSPSSQTFGYWQGRCFPQSGSSNAQWLFHHRSTFGLGGGNIMGYKLQVTTSATSLRSYFNASDTVLISVARAPSVGDVYKITRAIDGTFELFINGVSQGTAVDLTYTISSSSNLGYLAAAGCEFGDQVQQDLNGSLVYPFGSSLESRVFDLTASVSSFGVFQATTSFPAGASADWYTATSDDGVTFDSWVSASVNAPIASAVKRYIKYKVVLDIPYGLSTGGIPANTPTIFDVTLNYFTAVAQPKWSPVVNFYLTDSNGICDLSQQVADNLGGDTAIINDIAVTSAPQILSGADTDTQWQGVAGSPPAAISAGNVLNVVVGTLTFNCAVSSGMDTSRMGSGLAIAITWGTATGTAAITYIHPTKPILTLTVTGPGTITDLRLIGKSFQAIETPYQALSSDAASIARHKKRHQDLSNDYIRDGSIALVIAQKVIANQAKPSIYIPKFEIFPPRINMQPGDRINVINAQTGISKDYYVLGYSRFIDIAEDGADAGMSLVLMDIPTV